MPSSLGPAELLVILVFALIVLGPKRLPDAGRQLGKALAEVRRWSQGFQSEIRSALDPEPAPPMPRTPTPLATPSPTSLTEQDAATRQALVDAGVIAPIAEDMAAPTGAADPVPPVPPVEPPAVSTDSLDTASPDATVPSTDSLETASPDATVPGTTRPGADS